MPINCAVWCDGVLRGTYQMSEAEYDEIERICQGSPVSVDTSSWKGRKMPFSHIRAKVVEHIASPTPNEFDSRECYPDDREFHAENKVLEEVYAVS